MYVPAWHKSSVFSQISHLIKYHKAETIFVLFIALWVMYIFNVPAKYQLLTSQLIASPVPEGSSGITRPLTRVDDPRYAHEYDRRTQHITTQLEQLKANTQADKAYVVSYGYGSGRIGGILELKIARIFEVGQEGLPHRISDFQDLSRKNWLHINRDGSSTGGFLPGPAPRSYGMELYNEHGGAIGYIGIEYWQEDPVLRGNEMPLLRRTASLMKIALLQSLKHLNSPEAQER